MGKEIGDFLHRIPSFRGTEERPQRKTQGPGRESRIKARRVCLPRPRAQALQFEASFPPDREGEGWLDWKLIADMFWKSLGQKDNPD